MYGLQPNKNFYSKIIQAYGRNGDIDAAIAIFDDMKKRQICPNSYMYHALMDQCPNNNRFPEIKELSLEMERRRIPKSKLIYDVIIKTKFLKGKPEKAQQIFSEHFGKPKVHIQTSRPHLDCHKLSPETAFVQMQLFLKSHDKSPFSIIVGYGWHIKNKFRMRDFFIEHLKDMPLYVKVHSSNNGVLEVSFKEKVGEGG